MEAPVGEVLRVADVLIKRIVADQYSPGLRLPAEVELAAEFSCGRSTIREALRHLASLNLVRSRRGSGAIVLDFRREGGLDLVPIYLQVGEFDHPLPVIVMEMLHIRTMLACEAARLAALYAHPERVERVRRLINSTEPHRLRPLDHALHELDVFRQLVHSSSIWPAAWLANQFIRIMRQVNEMVADQLGPPPEDWRQVMTHLIDLIHARDAEGATAHLRAYFDRVDQTISAELERILGQSSW